MKGHPAGRNAFTPQAAYLIPILRGNNGTKSPPTPRAPAADSTDEAKRTAGS
jgi:hypothetical protein